MLVHRLSANWPGVVRYPARAFGHSAALGLIVFILLGATYFGRSLRYDLARVAEMPERSIIFDRNKKEIGSYGSGWNIEIAPTDAESNERTGMLGA